MDFFSKHPSNADFRNLTHLKSDYTKSAVYIVQFHKEKKKIFESEIQMSLNAAFAMVILLFLNSYMTTT